MDIKLRIIMQKIDGALISDADKERLYESILTSIQDTVWPIVVKHMPKDKVDAVLGNPDSLTVETYTDLIDQAMTDGTAVDEIEPAVATLFADIEKILKQKGVV